MAFTTNKNLEQPARGDYVGTWDTPVNSNTGIIDNSFGGVATVALTNSNVTLSAGQYQNVFLVFTGAISANIAITFPAVGSFYTVQNLTSNTSAFYLTAVTTASTGQGIGLPPGEAVEIFTDGTNVKFRNLARVGSLWEYVGSSVPSWVSQCTVPPYLNCDGTSFSSATYPVLSAILGGTTLPDLRGRYRATLNQGTGRITSGTSTGGVDGNTNLATGGSQTTTLSSENAPPIPLSITDPGHTHFVTNSDLTAANTAVSTTNYVAQGWQPAGSDLGYALRGDNDAADVGLSSPSTTGISITAGSTSPTNFSNLPPTAVVGITMIRAA
jgi:hypothetical protein